MYGGFIGDLVFKTMEGKEMRAKEEGKILSDRTRKEVLSFAGPLFPKNCTYTEETLFCIPIMNTIINNSDYKKISTGSEVNKDNLVLAISPIGFYFDNMKDVYRNTKKIVKSFTKDESSLIPYTALTTSIFLLKTGKTKEQTKNIISEEFGYDLDLYFPDLIETNIFTTDINTTFKQALFCFLISSNFEDAIRKTLSIGGNPRITGALAESYYGIPDYLKKEVRTYLPDYVLESTDRFYDKMDKGIDYEKRLGYEINRKPIP